MGRRLFTSVVVALAAATLSAACGSTLKTLGDAGGQQAATDGSSGVAGTDVDSPAGSAADGTALATGVASPTGARGGSVARASGSATTRPAANGGGSSATAGAGTGPLKLGVEYPVNWDTGSQSIGANTDAGPPSGQQFKDMYQAAIDDVNANGGIHGRKIEPVWATYDITNTNSAEVQDQAACAAFTEDNHVFAALLSLNYTEVLINCLEKAGALTVAPFDGKSNDDQVVYDRYPHFVSGEMSLNRMAHAYVDGLADQGFFDQGAKVGLIVTDSPAYARAEAAALKPALARRGVTITDEAKIQHTTSLQTFTNAGAQLQNAILRFRSLGVTHVIFFAGPGTAIVWFMEASPQGYNPRVGLSTNDYMHVCDGAQQCARAVGVGWNRGIDIPNPPANARAKKCEDLVYAKIGKHWPRWSWELCDAVWTFAAAANAASLPLTRDSVLGGFEKMGVVEQATLFRTRYAPGRRDGVAAVANAAYFADCDCFRYTSAPRDV